MALGFWPKPSSKTLATSVSVSFHLARASAARHVPRSQERNVCFQSHPEDQLHATAVTRPTPIGPSDLQVRNLLQSCPGCGAFAQSLNSDQPGFYSTDRKPVKAFIANRGHGLDEETPDVSEVFNHVLDSADKNGLSELGVIHTEGRANPNLQNSKTSKASVTPICDRCHDLKHHNSGTPIINPTVQSIQDIISESPYKHNHVYHVLDAADFPLSLIPSLQRHLSLAPQRSLNRRARTSHFQRGRKADLSFIITRSDLLAPKKDQVDGLMPYILKVLREALFGASDNVRLGNVRCVSSKRGWWTKQVKEDVWNRGGGGWMVGKVNVGKSSLFESVFPKGRNDEDHHHHQKPTAHGRQLEIARKSSIATSNGKESNCFKREFSEEPHTQALRTSLLPPAPSEISYPMLPLVSSLPGTTASPIRVPFGGGKGELVDLPGLSRGNLGDFVMENHKLDLVMRTRVKPKQLTIKPGQSLLVGGLVRITPVTPNVTLLAYPFLPLKSHVASTGRAIAIHTQKEDSGVPSIAKPGIGSRMDPAGSYSLRWDVTKYRAGPLTRRDAAGLSPEILPFVVLSTDILIEGCGWIELVAQVRKKDIESAARPGDFFDGRPYPRVDIFSPDGRHVGVRRPMGAWLLNSGKPRSLSKATFRPRRSMKGVKKACKRTRRDHS